MWHWRSAAVVVWVMVVVIAVVVSCDGDDCDECSDGGASVLRVMVVMVHGEWWVL